MQLSCIIIIITFLLIIVFNYCNYSSSVHFLSEPPQEDMMMSSEAQDKTTGSEQQLPTSNNNNTSATDHKRSSKDSINPITCPFTHTVKEAVAIAAGKKESDGDDDDGKNIRSNMLCYLYWLLVVLILGLISFTVWLSIQLARRHSEMNGLNLVV